MQQMLAVIRASRQAKHSSTVVRGKLEEYLRTVPDGEQALKLLEDEEKLDDIIASVDRSMSATKGSHLDVLTGEIDGDSYEGDHVQPTGFSTLTDEQAYIKLKPFCLLASAIEGNDQAEFLAYKLTVTFGDAVTAMNYLTDFDTEQLQRRTPTNVPLHDATLFSLPVGTWDVDRWRKAAIEKKMEDTFVKAFAFAHKIDAFLNDVVSEKSSASYQKSQAKLDKYCRRDLDSRMKGKEDETRLKAGAKYDESFALIHPGTGALLLKEDFIEALEETRQQEITSFRQELKKTGITKSEVKRIRRSLSKLDIEPSAFKAKSIKKYDIAMKITEKGKETYVQSKLSELEKQKETAVVAEMNKFMKGDYETLSSDDLLTLSRIIGYERSAESLLATDFLLGLSVPERFFDQYLDQCMDKAADSSQVLPDIVIDGKEFGFPGHYLRKLSTDDPRAAFLGYPTGCCQNIGSAGEECAVFGANEPNSGFYVLCKGKAPKAPYASTMESLKSRDIVAETWAWRTPGSNTVVFDSFEVSNRISREAASCFFYQAGRKLAKEDPSIHQVNVGTNFFKHDGYEELPSSSSESLFYAEGEGDVLARGKKYTGYKDSDTQSVMFNVDNPHLAEAYYQSEALLKKITSGEKAFSPEILADIAEVFIKKAASTHPLTEGLRGVLEFALAHLPDSRLDKQHVNGKKIIMYAAGNKEAFETILLRYPEARRAAMITETDALGRCAIDYALSDLESLDYMISLIPKEKHVDLVKKKGGEYNISLLAQAAKQKVALARLLSIIPPDDRISVLISRDVASAEEDWDLDEIPSIDDLEGDLDGEDEFGWIFDDEPDTVLDALSHDPATFKSVLEGIAKDFSSSAMPHLGELYAKASINQELLLMFSKVFSEEQLKRIVETTEVRTSYAENNFNHIMTYQIETLPKEVRLYALSQPGIMGNGKSVFAAFLTGNGFLKEQLPRLLKCLSVEDRNTLLTLKNSKTEETVRTMIFKSGLLSLIQPLLDEPATPAAIKPAHATVSLNTAERGADVSLAGVPGETDDFDNLSFASFASFVSDDAVPLQEEDYRQDLLNEADEELLASGDWDEDEALHRQELLDKLQLDANKPEHLAFWATQTHKSFMGGTTFKGKPVPKTIKKAFIAIDKRPDATYEELKALITDVFQPVSSKTMGVFHDAPSSKILDVLRRAPDLASVDLREMPKKR